MENQENIYQTPSSDLDSPADSGICKFKRFSAWGVFGLSLITFGIYPAYWLYNRSKVLNSFHENRISSLLLSVFLLFVVLSFSIGVLSGAIPENTVLAGVNAAISIPYVILYVVLLFKFRGRIKEVSGREVGPVLTFFGSAIYLQYKINCFIDGK